ncbi:MAG: aldose 1-epimerase family protein [Prevotella sp.]|nr:aldose 1-epimerase family protein [Prevotella sp.]
MEQIKNEKLTITVSEHGAELQSIKDTEGKEYLWQADSRFWNRHSPILFPLVCGVWKDTYRTEGQEYALGRHGFARDSDFKLVKKTTERVTYVLESNEHSLALYPYHFVLSVTYRLDGNKIHVIWHVHNTDTREIHFQIGAHPAFNLPDLQPGEPMHGQLLFDNEGPLQRIVGNIEGCITHNHSEVTTKNGVWSFNEESFKEDSVQFDHCQLHKISILDRKYNKVVTVSFNMPCVAIWSPYGKNAPFVCIEPWFGVSDHVEYDGELKDKYLMNHLLPGGSFMSEYVIEIGES